MKLLVVFFPQMKMDIRKKSKIIRSVNQMAKLSSLWKKNSKIVTLVPTMGSLHEGHVSLIKKAKESSEITVVSIFINPTQFDSKEDFINYPSNNNLDFLKCNELGVDVIFIPRKDEMFDESYSTWVYEDNLSKKGLCDRTRSIHFKGVCTIVLKLFNLISPNIVIFGEKDAQQLRIINKMIVDLNLSIKLISCPIIRDANGLAISSRNQRLTKEELKRASKIFKSFQKVSYIYRNGETSSSVLIEYLRTFLDQNKITMIDYIKIVDIDNLNDISKVRNNCLIMIAVYIGQVRLIDNYLLSN